MVLVIAPVLVIATGGSLLPAAMTIAVCLLRLSALSRLLSTRLAIFGRPVAPALVVARAEAADRLDHTKIMVGILPVGFRQNSVARRSSLSGQRLVLVEHLMSVAAHPHVRPATVEYLVPVRRPVRIVMLLVMVAATAATTATATRQLTIVWSH